MRAATLARLSLVALVAATFLAIFYAQELKREAPLLQYAKPGAVTLRPVGPRPPHVYRFAHFDLRTNVADTLSVSIVARSNRRVVDVLAPAPMTAYHRRPFTWDGRTSAGALAPAGVYVLSIRFEHARRTVNPAMTISLEGPPG